MTVTTTVETDNMTIQFEADTERCDYGVSGSPTWYETVNEKVVALEIMGHEIDLKSLPKGLLNDLMEFAPDDIDDWY